MTNEQQDFTASSLAKSAGVTFGYICQLCRSGKLSCKKFGSYWLIPYEVGQAWLEQRKADKPEEL